MISVIIPILILDNELEKITKDCLDSLKRTGNWYELIIIDNGSPIKIDFDADVVVRNKKNLGNAAAWNQGIKLAKGENILLSDNDVIFSEGWENMANFTANAIVFPESKSDGQHDFRPRLAGFFWMMNRETLNKVGMVSEEYGLGYFEDTDYFMRAQDLGINLKCLDIKILHKGKATANKLNLDSLVEENQQKYLKKHGSKFPVLNL